ncbi:iron chelate uptake ABC transporter family permease subunit [Corynebacterium hindlerae]|uniref:Iron chelate uptake ABC transporter family permease subunit n=1 Tax=Corynebacterium hindlerae TaxID=699041 RepID=A0A7G5FDY8_9CORY|nr:iron chelate uptake ABC transporter family permease subunit [Corynebacterium hindlerae]QMV84829.1 iron chelate uptake ABC transporter family permease subunit [Corynebacterium hindlerae]
MTPLATTIRHHRRRATTTTLIKLCLIALLTIALWLGSLMLGDSFYSLADVIGVLRGDTVPGASFTVGELRLPRATVAIVAGFAFGVSGVIFQTMLRNQLASPDIIGISAGAAAAGATMIVLFHAPQTVVSAVALVTSLSVAGLVYLLSIKSGFAGTRLILMGIGVAAMLQAWTSYVLSKASAWDLPTATRWLTGSLNNMSWERGLPLMVTVGVVVPLLLIGTHRLSILRLGDDVATSLGLRVNLLRGALLIGAVTLISVATSATGPISFVAFMAGPIAMRLFPRGANLVLPAGIVGALLILAADFAGQFLVGTRYPVGVITGSLGAPFLIYLLVKTSH